MLTSTPITTDNLVAYDHSAYDAIIWATVSRFLEAHFQFKLDLIIQLQHQQNILQQSVQKEKTVRFITGPDSEVLDETDGMQQGQTWTSRTSWGYRTSQLGSGPGSEPGSRPVFAYDSVSAFPYKRFSESLTLNSLRLVYDLFRFELHTGFTSDLSGSTSGAGSVGFPGLAPDRDQLVSSIQELSAQLLSSSRQMLFEKYLEKAENKLTFNEFTAVCLIAALLLLFISYVLMCASPCRLDTYTCPNRPHVWQKLMLVPMDAVLAGRVRAAAAATDPRGVPVHAAVQHHAALDERRGGARRAAERSLLPAAESAAAAGHVGAAHARYPSGCEQAEDEGHAGHSADCRWRAGPGALDRARSGARRADHLGVDNAALADGPEVPRQVPAPYAQAAAHGRLDSRCACA